MYSDILIPLDLSHKEQAEELAAVAGKLAAGEQARLHLLYVDQSFIHRASYPQLDESELIGHKSDAQQQMKYLLTDLAKNLELVIHCRNGTAHDQILESAAELDVDAIVMMARKPGISSYFIGSNAERVVRHAPCSVFVIRSENSNS